MRLPSHFLFAEFFCDLGFRSLKQILDMRVFDLMNELNALLNVDKRENEIVGGEPDEGEEPPEKKPRDLER